MADRFTALSMSDGIKIAAILALSALGLAWFLSTHQNNVCDAFPRVADSRLRSIVWPSYIQDLVWKGYRDIIKPASQPFSVRWWGRDFLILPPKYLPSLRDADWAHLSFFRTISDAFYLHTSVGNLYDSDATVQVVKRGLNPRMPQLTTILEKEIEYAISVELGGSHDNGPRIRNAQNFFTSIVHRSASRILIGEELCRNDKFIKTSIEFVMSIFYTALIIVKLPLGPLREWLAYLLAWWHRQKLKQCTRMLLPVIEARIDRHLDESNASEESDAIEWHLMLSPSISDVDPQRLAAELMHNLWAGTSAPGGLTTEIFFQILLEPQYKEDIVREAKEALGGDQHWTEKSLSKLPLLDSFIREINRLNPTGSITCSRTVLGKPFVFPDGLSLPVGTRFGFPTRAMQNDDDATFDGFRFAKSHTGSEKDGGRIDAPQGATTMSSSNLA
ncbi:Uu.00g118380.m01.CDS01 [Anthostomella pinea]|uniref:Uu.00g118380.m01.CDS01 n=1 Tax=Anthostomella pinea TaxID=933095 RepID=A0AAI8VGC4_9PEZI|nr:Uu.00g118380.m01.CDS01 [Anthostomella pinea]